jgi:hypothetical protein
VGVRRGREKTLCARDASLAPARGPSTSPFDVGALVTLRQAINSAAGLAFLGGLAYCSYGYFTAESRVKAVCAAIPAGATLKSLTQFASSHGLSAPSGRDPDFLVETRTFGRYGCKEHMKNGVVTQVEYNFAD